MKDLPKGFHGYIYFYSDNREFMEGVIHVFTYPCDDSDLILLGKVKEDITFDIDQTAKEIESLNRSREDAEKEIGESREKLKMINDRLEELECLDRLTNSSIERLESIRESNSRKSINDASPEEWDEI